MLLKRSGSIKKFLKLPHIDKLLLLEAVLSLFLSKLVVCLPFKHYIKLLKPSTTLKTDLHPIQLRRIAMALHRANYLAWWQNICLVKSVAGRLMLQRRGVTSVLSLGVQFNDGKTLAAHAWLKSGEVYITPKGSENFKEIFSI